MTDDLTPAEPVAAPSVSADPVAPAAPVLYTVNRAADGAQVRAELSLEDSQSECAMLNMQARQQVGMTAPELDARGATVKGARPIYGSMFQGEIAQYEVRSASGLVI